MNNIQKALNLKKELDKLRPLKKEDEARIWQKFRLDWNYHSNSIEGNSLTYGETKALLFFNITAQGKPLKDHLEITGHNEAILWLIDLVNEKNEQEQISEKLIKELHQIILKESYEMPTISPEGIPGKRKIEIGKYKSVANHVQTNTGEIFYFASPEETPAKMTDLIDWFRAEKKKKDVNPIILAASFHYKFVRIHPFDDGNGRMSRILMNLILMQFGFPPVIVKTEDKANYISALEQSDIGIIKPFIDYIALNLISSLDLMIKGAKGESIEDPDDLDKELAILDEKLKPAKNEQTNKTKENVKNIYNNSIKILINEFIKKSQKFDKYYKTCKLEFGYNDYSTQGTIGIYNFDKLSNNLMNINYLRLGINFINFKPIEINSKNPMNSFTTYLFIYFLNKEYMVKAQFNNLNFIRKKYNAQLNNDEISRIIKWETDRHIAFIEKKIKDKSK